VTRGKEAGFARRLTGDGDGCRVAVHPTRAGERRLAAQHRAELRSRGEVFPIASISLESAR
jgi:hypothetical protein